MWYEILINGYSFYVTNLTRAISSRFLLSETLYGELTICNVTYNERCQINKQIDCYSNFGTNTVLSHLGRSGVYSQIKQ